MSKQKAGSNSSKRIQNGVTTKAKCVGYRLDALDAKMLWAEAKIIKCDRTTQKIRVHFIGYTDRHDIWTDTISIAAHGEHVPLGKKGKTKWSWDGNMDIFSDLLVEKDEKASTELIVDEPVKAAPSSKPRRFASKKKRPASTAFSSDKSPLKVAKQSTPPALDQLGREYVAVDVVPMNEVKATRDKNASFLDENQRLLLRCAEVWKQQVQSK